MDMVFTIALTSRVVFITQRISCFGGFDRVVFEHK